jgi:CDP-diacylglycerol--glycerol-3-phosphate 3-phosphatidyltransferase
MRKMLPNILTVLRIVLALTGAWALWQSYFWSVDYNVPLWLGDASVAAATIGAYGVAAFVVAALTDWLDGWLARRWAAESRLGSILDPVADKLLVDAYLLVFTMILGSPVTLAVPVGAIVLRDAVITLTRMVGRDSPEPTLPVSPAAKLKTAIAMIVTAFPFVAALFGVHTTLWVVESWIIAVWLTAALSLATGLSYLRRKPRAQS